jgi:hypothetical protein
MLRVLELRASFIWMARPMVLRGQQQRMSLRLAAQ